MIYLAALTRRSYRNTLPYKVKMQVGVVMTDVEHALSQIASIRAQVAGSTRFSGIAPISNMLTGFFTILVTLFFSDQKTLLEPSRFVLFWGGYLLLMTLFGTVSTTVRAYRVHGKRAPYMLAAALHRVFPFFAAGGTISWIVCNFSVESIMLLPGLWLMFIGMAGFSMMTILPHAIIIASAWFFLWGAIVMMLGVQAEAVSHWMVGVPLGGGQIAVAIILRRSEGVISVQK